MADEGKLQEEVARGQRAEQERDELRSAFEELKASYYEAWGDSDPRDTQGREHLFHAVQILGKVEDHLRKVADGGKVAAKEIASLKDTD